MIPDSPTAIKMSSTKPTPTNPFVVPDVLEVQEIPSEDVRIFPSAPTVTYLLFPYVIPKR